MALDHLATETKDELAGLALALSGNPKTRKNFLGLIKEANPNLPIPEIDEPARIAGELKERDDRFEKYVEEQNKKERERSLASERKSVIEEHNLSDEDIKKVEKIMTERRVFNYADAAKLYNLEREPATPVVYGMSEGVGELPADEGLMENPEKWSLRTAHAMIDDIKRQQTRSRF